MTDALLLHATRAQRMLCDLDIDPAAVLVDRDFALWDAVTDRRLTPPLGNQTLAEGLASAMRLAGYVINGAPND